METREPQPPPSIAVIVPCFNMARFLNRAIRSLVEQAYPNLHIVIVDDGSTDESIQTAESFGTAVTLIRGQHQGASAARNLGLAATKADYVLFMDADDYLHGPYLTQLAQAITPDSDLIVGAYVRNRAGIFDPPETYCPTRDLIAQFITDSFQPAVFLWRRGFVLAAGGWRPDLPISQDFEFALRLLLRRPVIRFANPQAAYAVYWQYESVTRITGTLTRPKAETRLGVLRSFKPALLALQNPAITAALAERYAAVAALLFATSYTDLGRQAVADLRALGIAPPPGGSRANRLATNLLGLERKTRLSALYYRLSGRPRPYPFNLVKPTPLLLGKSASFLKKRSKKLSDFSGL